MFDDYFDKNIYHLIGDILSLATISLCIMCKVPQIQKISEQKSAIGISFMALMLELFSYSVMMSYNYLNGYALMSYMEYPLILLQEYVLIYVVLKYKNLLNSTAYACGAIYFVCLLCIFMKMLPAKFTVIFVPLCTPIGATSKIMQLVAIIRSKNSNSVSLMTWGFSVFTNLTRIYTISIDSGDKMLLSNFIISCALSTSVLFAAAYYKDSKKHAD